MELHPAALHSWAIGRDGWPLSRKIYCNPAGRIITFGPVIKAVEMEIKSPVNGSTRLRLVRRFDAAAVIRSYQDLYNIDVRAYFEGQQQLELYECLDSGLQFYYPHTIVGDGRFYESIQKFDWYYREEKWEFSQGAELINNDDKVLEIGSGAGHFLTMLQAKTPHAEGLELNEDAVRKIKAKGMTGHLMKVGDFELMPGTRNAYDVVCSFQVYEHIENIGEVIRSSLNLLKPGGRLIVSVPNNNCLFNEPSINPFNMPPHHQGLWYPETFEKLSGLFDIRLLSVHFEPSTFINGFRLAAADVQIKRASGAGRTLQYLRSLGTVFGNSELRKGRTMLACYEKLK